MRHLLHAFVLAAALLAAARADVPAATPTLSITRDRADGIYEAGQEILFTIRSDEPGPLTATYTLKRGQQTLLDEGTFELNAAHHIAWIEAAPGTLLLDVVVTRPDGSKLKLQSGAAIAPARITPAAPAPADFDAFWASKVDELKRIPMNPQLEPAPPTTGPTTQPVQVNYYKLTLDGFRESQIRGQLAEPAGDGKCPALLIVQWAGVYGLERAWAVDRAKEGWLTLNILPHDLPIDASKEFYKAQAEGPLKNYAAIGNDSRDESYFLRMYLSCYRAADYLAAHPRWDGKTLVVMGTSQGGMQAMMLAGLHPQISAALANVPAGCDFLGADVGRRPGWPQWVANAGEKDLAKVREASRYFDVVNFAPRIKAPTLVALGLIDQTCPPEGIFAAANLIPAKKQVLVMAESDHQGTSDTQRPFYDTAYGVWLPLLREGRVDELSSSAANGKK